MTTIDPRTIAADIMCGNARDITPIEIHAHIGQAYDEVDAEAAAVDTIAELIAKTGIDLIWPDGSTNTELDAARVEIERLTAELDKVREVVEAAKAWRAQFGEWGPLDSADTPAGDLTDAVDAYTDATGTPVCNCCFVDGSTQRCGRPATAIVDVPPFGFLDVAETCRSRINGEPAGEPERPAGSGPVTTLSPHRIADGLQNDLDSATKANTAWANENAELKARLGETTDQAMADGWNRVADEMDAEAGTDTRAYLIWSNHHQAWWAPNSRGYRSNVNDAGRYTLADAQKEMTRGCGCCQVPEVPVLAELTTGAGDRKLRSVIAAATKAAIEAGQVNRYYTPKVVTVELPAEAVTR